MRITIASRGSPDYAAGRALVRSRHHPFFSMEPVAHPHCFVVASASRQVDDRPLACAGLTFPGRAPLVSERRLGRPIEAVIGAREGHAVERCTIVEIDSLASNDPTAENELLRALPLLAWCLGRRYAICKTTPQMRAGFDRIGTRFVTLRADRAFASTTGVAATAGSPTVLGYSPTTPPTINDISGSGHYCFDDVVIPV